MLRSTSEGIKLRYSFFNLFQFRNSFCQILTEKAIKLSRLEKQSPKIVLSFFTFLFIPLFRKSCFQKKLLTLPPLSPLETIIQKRFYFFYEHYNTHSPSIRPSRIAFMLVIVFSVFYQPERFFVNKNRQNVKVKICHLCHLCQFSFALFLAFFLFRLMMASEKLFNFSIKNLLFSKDYFFSFVVH